MRVGRNEPCTCGSGKKYKNCCEGKATRGVPRGLWILIGVMAVVAAVGVIPSVIGDKSGRTPTASAAAGGVAAASMPKPQPPGPVPAGKVWSAEHGHWHDAPGAAASGGAAPASPIKIEAVPGGDPGLIPAATPTQVRMPTPLTPQPPGPVPAGKVWSAEHGHWHDLPKN